MPNLTQDAVNQDRATEPSAIEPTGGGIPDAIDDNKGVQPQGQEGNAELGPRELPPEMESARKELHRDYHEKTQKLAAERRVFEEELKTHKQNTEVLQRLFDQPWFQKAYEAEKAVRNGSALPENMTDDQWHDLSDPRKLVDYMRKYLETIVENKLAPELKRTVSEVRRLRTDKEADDMARDYPDFKEAKESGALDKYLDQGINNEQAYAMWRLKNGPKNLEHEAKREAERILAARKSGSVEKSGVPVVTGQQIFEADTLNEAIDKAFDARRQGVTNFRFKKRK